MARHAKITSFNKDEATRFNAHMREVLIAEAAKFNVDVKSLGGNFTEGDVTIKYKFVVKGAVENGTTREATAFKRNARYFGLNESNLGQSFTSGSQTYTITGLNTRAKKFPILARGADGKSYKFPASVVKAGL